jgi:UPF0755 protein
MKRINILIIIVVLFFILQAIYLPKSFSETEDKLFLIEKGENLFEIAQGLEHEELIRSRFFFDFFVLIKNSQSKLQAGEYFLNPSMSILEIANKIIFGDTATVTITIPEGWNLRDIAWYFENQGMFQAEELFELIGFPLINYSVNTDLPKPKDFSLDYEFLKDKPKNISLEGYLFPDTYETAIGISLEDIIRKMLDNFDKKLTPELKETFEEQRKTVFEIIIMASLLEKEVKDFEEKKIVAGILWKRMENKIGLHVDATISYITGKKTVKISKEETEIDSLYNTYKYRGLPLGPICNPGLESIIAAIHPTNSDYWYYLSTPEGETIFNKTLEEHNIDKAKYLK